MPKRNLPERPSLEYLKKLAKERLAVLRATNPEARLGVAQLMVAREHGFSSWRALKAAIDRQRAAKLAELLRVCETGDLDTLRTLLKNDPSLVHARDVGDNAGPLHQIFSAIAMGDEQAVRKLVHEDRSMLSRRRSRFEEGQTPLHFALAAPDGQRPKEPHYEMAELLIELGANLEAKDDKGRTPLAVAMLHGDLEAMRRLKAAGAKEPDVVDPSSLGSFDALRDSLCERVTPMLCVADVDAAVGWYTAVGFTLQRRHPEKGKMSWAALSFGATELMLQPRGDRPQDQVALWFYTYRIETLYELFKNRQLAAAKAALADKAGETSGIHFLEDLYKPFYGGRQFSVRDNHGVELVFYQPADSGSPGGGS